MHVEGLKLPKGSSTSVVGFARSPYFLQRSLRDLTNSSKLDWIRSARTWLQYTTDQKFQHREEKSIKFLSKQICKNTWRFSSVPSCSIFTIAWYISIFLSYKQSEHDYSIIFYLNISDHPNELLQITRRTWMSRNVASSIVNLEATSPACLYFSSYFLAKDSTWKVSLW